MTNDWWNYHRPDWYFRHKLHLLKKSLKNTPKLLWKVYSSVVILAFMAMGLIKIFPWFLWSWRTFVNLNPQYCCLTTSPVPELLISVEVSLIFMVIISIYMDFMARGHIGYMRREKYGKFGK